MLEEKNNFGEVKTVHGRNFQNAAAANFLQNCNELRQKIQTLR